MDLVGNKPWITALTYAVIAVVAAFVMQQTGNSGCIKVSDDQYTMAILITTFMIIIYYARNRPSSSGPPDNMDNLQATVTATCCGGDIRNQMVNANCPPYISPPDPYPPCIDNIYNETCYSKPFVPLGAIPCDASDDRRFKIRWDKKKNCPMHKQVVLTGDYLWAPGTPNWQNRGYLDDNSKLWYGPDPGHAPFRDNNKNIVGQRLPNDDKNGKFSTLRVDQTPATQAYSALVRKPNGPREQDFLWGNPARRAPRFIAPEVGYVPAPNQLYQIPNPRPIQLESSIGILETVKTLVCSSVALLTAFVFGYQSKANNKK